MLDAHHEIKYSVNRPKSISVPVRWYLWITRSTVFLTTMDHNAFTICLRAPKRFDT